VVGFELCANINPDLKSLLLYRGTLGGVWGDDGHHVWLFYGFLLLC